MSERKILTETKISAHLTIKSTGNTPQLILEQDNSFDNYNLWCTSVSGDLIFRRNSEETARLTASGNLGVGITSPQTTIHAVSSNRLSHDNSNRNFVEERVVEVNTHAASIFKLVPSQISGVWTQGIIEIYASGHNVGLASGSIKMRCIWDIADAPPTVVANTEEWRYGTAPQANISIVSNDIYVNIYSSNGQAGNPLAGVIYVKFICPTSNIPINYSIVKL